jgi:trans-o-hydroxybenzylidenepyruvate hydratase-aldolase
MLSAKDLRGLMAMMPAFTKDGAGDLAAVDTVDVQRLRSGLDRMISDGADIIATTGSFGECHTLLWDEFRTLTHETVDVAKQRVPLFIGVTSANAREVVQKMREVDQTKADGVLLGVPYYFASTVENAVRFFREIAEMFPKLNILIYHNPSLHNVTLPVEAFDELVKIPQIIGMKDSHRDNLTFMKLRKRTAGKIASLCSQVQYCTYAPLGAEGFWSIDAWMGPWPVLALRDAVARGDWELAKAITLDLSPAGTRKVNMSWRETASKIGIGIAGYANPGPLRPPFLEVPADVVAEQKKEVARWKALSEKYGSARRVDAAE